jgi:hypothetical protein
MLTGDSAPHIVAQVAAMETDPGYAEQVGVKAIITAEQLRGLAAPSRAWRSANAHRLSAAGQLSRPPADRFVTTLGIISWPSKTGISARAGVVTERG